MSPHLLYNHLSNNSEPPGFIWEEFDFEACDSFSGSSYCWRICTFLCFVFGFPASAAILWEMYKIHRRGTTFTPNSFFILNLSIMDFLFLAYIPLGLLNHILWKIWVLEAVWNAVFALNTCGRPLLMACVCLDCYLAVVQPITYHKKKSLAPRMVMAGAVWALTMASGVAYFLYFKLYFSALLIVPFVAAILIISVCDSFILDALLKSDADRKHLQQQKKRAVQTLVNSLLMTVFSYLPPVLLLSIFKPLLTFNMFLCVVGIPINITSSLGSVIMPLLHLNNQGKLDCLRRGLCRK